MQAPRRVRLGNTESRRPLAIIGPAIKSLDIALRRVLKSKERLRPLIILDYQGRAAALLRDNNKGNLHKGPILWCDLSDRQKPIALFRLGRVPSLKRLLETFLTECAQNARIQIEPQTIRWAAELAWSLADNSTVTLASFYRYLNRPEIQNLSTGYTVDMKNLSYLIRLLGWILRFPSAWSVSEGNNPVDLGKALEVGSTVWLEMSLERFEQIEHRVVTRLAEMAVNIGLEELGGKLRIANVAEADEVIVFYVFPKECPITFGQGRSVNGTAVKHVAVFSMSSNMRMPPAARSWLENGADAWFVGPIGDISRSSYRHWLTHNDIKRISGLRDDQIWVRSGKNGSAVTMRTRADETVVPLAHSYRMSASKTRHVSPIRQFTSALDSVVTRNTEHTALYRRLCDKEMLRSGWLHVYAGNRRSCGSDEVTVAEFKSRLDAELNSLADELTTRRYQCRPLRRIYISKPDGGQRPLGVVSVRDRVAQAACLQLLEPIFEPRFSHFSFAFRPRRGAHHAIALARSMVASGCSWVVIADIRKCFDTIDHDTLLAMLAESIADQDLIALLHHWLSVDVIDFNDITPVEVGVPQGEVLSPLLANIYLDQLDKHLERGGLRFIRYADDIVIFCKSESEAKDALASMTDFLHQALHLAIKPTKTQHAAVKEGFDFLGFRLNERDIGIEPGRLDRVASRTTELLRLIGNERRHFVARANDLEKVNSIIRGFRNYFLIEDSTTTIHGQLKRLDQHVIQTAAVHLPASLLKHPLWYARERFFITRNTGNTDTKDINAVAGYPEEPVPRSPFVLPADVGQHPREKERVADEGLATDDQTPTLRARESEALARSPR